MTAAPPTAAPPAAQSVAGLTITLEHLLYAVLFVAALFLRLIALGSSPLSPAEAAQVWPAWLTANGLDASAASPAASALLHSFQLLIYWLGVEGDAASRLAPALAGAALVLLAPFWRPRLGRTAALCLALLWALSPWLTALSRLADGTALAVFCALLVLTALEWLPLERSGGTDAGLGYRPLAADIAALGAGLLFVSGAAGWSFLPVLLLYGLWFSLPALAGDAGGAVRLPWSRLAVLGGGAALLGATAWLGDLSGLRLIGSGLGLWLNMWARPDYGWSWVLFRLIAEGVLALLLGAAGLWLLWRSSRAADRRWARYLTIWLLWGLLLLPVQGPQALPLIELPLLFAAAAVLAALFDHFPGRLQPQAAVLLAGLLLLALSASFWLRRLAISPQFDLVAALTLLLLAVTAGVLILLFALWWDRSAAFWTGAVFGVLLLFGLSLAAGWRIIGHDHLLASRSGFLAVTTHPDVRQLADDLRTLSAQRTGDAGELPVQVQQAAAPDPVLGWYLRDRRRLAWVLAPDGVEVDGRLAPAITLGEEAPPGALAGALGSGYTLRQRWQPTALWSPLPPLEDGTPAQARLNALWSARGQPLLRWLLTGAAHGAGQEEGVVLWVPATEN